MERVRDRSAHVALLLGDLELFVEAAQARQVPNRRTCDGHEGSTADRGDCPATAGGRERAAHHHCRCRADLISHRIRPLKTHLRFEPTKSSKSRIKRLRGMKRPQYRLRVDEIRVYYDVTEDTVEVLAIITKSEAQAWLEGKGEWT